MIKLEGLSNDKKKVIKELEVSEETAIVLLTNSKHVQLPKNSPYEFENGHLYKKSTLQAKAKKESEKSKGEENQSK